MVPDRAAVGTRMRHLLDLMYADVARFEAELGLVDYRPRFSPVIRALVADGPLPIRDLAARIGVTHSAASQTVTQMTRSGLLTLTPGSDARQRIVHLTPKAHTLLPTIESAWSQTETAMHSLDRDLPIPLPDLLDALAAALADRPLYERIKSRV